MPPALPFVGGMPLPARVNEDGYVGALLGKPVEVVRCETVDLDVPATSEIVIEGHLSGTEMTLEGPMGEYAGYQFRGEGRPQPTYHVSAITHRTDPILPVVVAGEPVEEDHTAWGIPAAGRSAGGISSSGASRDHLLDTTGERDPLVGRCRCRATGTHVWVVPVSRP